MHELVIEKRFGFQLLKVKSEPSSSYFPAALKVLKVRCPTGAVDEGVFKPSITSTNYGLRNCYV